MIDDLRRDGIVQVEPFAFTSIVQEWHIRYGGHVYEAGSKRWDFYSGTCCWHPNDILAAPGLFEFFLSFTDIVEMYLGVLPRMYSVNVFQSHPGKAITSNIQTWHRDYDDTKFVGLFVYLSDVLSVEDGPHEYLKGTHLSKEPPVMPLTASILGPAGTAFLADTAGLHRGVPPTMKPRTMAWARWGVSERPESYAGAGTQPVPRSVLGSRYPTDPRLQETIRLVCE